MDPASLSREELDETLEALKRNQVATRQYLDTSTKGYKKVRQMRGADAHRKSWELEALMKRHQASLDKLDREIAAITGEIAKRDDAASA